jgi:hypothetical protein
VSVGGALDADAGGGLLAGDGDASFVLGDALAAPSLGCALRDAGEKRGATAAATSNGGCTNGTGRESIRGDRSTA